MSNAKAIYEGLASAGYSVSGGVNAPYIWLKTPDKMTSWEFFDYLLEKANIVGTSGFRIWCSWGRFLQTYCVWNT